MSCSTPQTWSERTSASSELQVWGKGLSTTNGSLYPRHVLTVTREVIKDFGSSEAVPCWVTSTPLAVDSLSAKQRNLIIVLLRKVNTEWGMNHCQKLQIRCIGIMARTAFPTANQHGMMGSCVVNWKEVSRIVHGWCHSVGVTTAKSGAAVRLRPEMARRRVFSVVTARSDGKLSNHSHIWSSGYWLLHIHAQRAAAGQLNYFYSRTKFGCVNVLLFLLPPAGGFGDSSLGICNERSRQGEERRKRNHSGDI